jgi:hypothetical protein
MKLPMATNRTGCSRGYLKRSHRSSMRKYNRYKKPVKSAVAPAAKAVSKASSNSSPESAVTVKEQTE